MEMEFRKALDESLERIRQGETVEACLQSHPQHAGRLESFLRAASIMWDLKPPEPSAAGMAAARSRLLERVAGGWKKQAAVGGMFKFAHAAVVAVVALFVASLGIVAASEGGVFRPFGGGGDKQEEVAFTATVVSVSEEQLVVMKGREEVFLAITDETRFQDESGKPMDGARIQKDDIVHVKAVVSGGRTFRALVVQLLAKEQVEHDPGPAPTTKPEEPSPSPKPDEPEERDKPGPTPVPTAEPGEGPHVVEEVSLEGKVTSVADGSFTLKKGEGTVITVQLNGETVVHGSLTTGVFVHVLAWKMSDGTVLAREVRVSAMEFWGVVVEVRETHLVLDTDFGRVTVWTGGAQFSGEPFPGVKVSVTAYKNSDGTYTATRVTVKTAEFSGTVQSWDGSVMIVFADGKSFTVRTDSRTSYPGGHPAEGDQVTVKAYRMGDGTYLAYQVTVKQTVFKGVITRHTPDEFTIHVSVGGIDKEVRYPSAEVIGGLEVGKTVEVHVDHVEDGVYFASLVKVIDP